MKYDVAKDQEKLFVAGTSKDVQNILNEEIKSNEHIAYLETTLDTINFQKGRLAVADYGISQLDKKENFKLASYFFIVSNLITFPPRARDFFTDVMVYCEDQMGPLKSARTIRETYQKEIRPAL